MTRLDVLRPLGFTLLALLACNSSTQRPADEPEPAGPAPAPRKPPTTTQTEWTPPPGGSTTAETEPASADAPEISRSLGSVGGAVVLWPRIVLPRGSGAPDEDTRRLAASVQARAAEVARRVFSQVDVRPEPERVCPKTGCQGVSIGILLARAGDGCSAIALVGPPGPSPIRLVPWSPGVVELGAPSVRFREHPERVVKVKDYARCSDLPGNLAAKDGQLEAALRATPGH